MEQRKLETCNTGIITCNMPRFYKKIDLRLIPEIDETCLLKLNLEITARNATIAGYQIESIAPNYRKPVSGTVLIYFPAERADSYGMHIATYRSNQHNGYPFVTAVANGGLADRAKLRKGDQIVSINGSSTFRMEHDTVIGLLSSKNDLFIECRRISRKYAVF